MEQWQREHIKKNLVKLMKDTNSGDQLLIAILIEYGLLGDGDVEDLNCISQPFNRNKTFYDRLQIKSNSYDRVISALREVGQHSPADILENGWVGRERPVEKAKEPVTPTAVQSPASSFTSSGQNVPTTSAAKSSSGVIDMNIPAWDASGPGTQPPVPTSQDDIDFMNNIRPLEVVVTRPTLRMAFQNDNYGLREDFKGYALIINIVEFENPKQNRDGAKCDTQYMNQLWTSLGYKCSVFEGKISKVEFLGILDQFKKVLSSTENGSPQSCVVFIGSHGSFSKIETSDHQSIHLFKDITYNFDADRCPQLKGKPKIFIIQACQRFQSDAVLERTQNDEMETPIDDAIICYSTIPGYVANRDVYLGTWYAYCLAKVFMENAHHMELLDLLSLTQDAMRNIHAQAPQGQLSTYMHLGIKKTYFNMYPR